MGRNRKKDFIFFLILLIITIFITFISFYLFYSSFNDGEEESIIYNLNSNLNYKVLLKENNFYENDFLEEDYNIVASSIDKINISFDYLLTTSKLITGKSYYTINSTIVAYQKSDNSKRKVWDYNHLILDKNITLFDEEISVIEQSDEFTIDYDFYKKKMDDYQKKYAVSLTGNLIIEIVVKSEFDYANFSSKIDLAEEKLILTIPLTESIIEIKKSVPDSIEQELIEKKSSSINYVKLIGAIIDIIFSILMSIYLGKIVVKLLGIDSKYEKELKRILRTYDYIIVNVKKIDLSKYGKHLYVDSFENLLDAQSELRVPILYSNIVPLKEDIFVIKYDNDLLIYKMESKLYDNKKGSYEKECKY